MKRVFCLFGAILLLIATAHASPSHGGAYSAVEYEQPYEAIRKVVHQKGSSVELDIPLYIGQGITMEIMNDCDDIEFIYSPRLAPDQSMVFIGYFLKSEPEKLRIIHLRQATLGANILVKNDTIENFSEYTYKHYKTRFFYVDKMEDISLIEGE